MYRDTRKWEFCFEVDKFLELMFRFGVHRKCRCVEPLGENELATGIFASASHLRVRQRYTYDLAGKEIKNENGKRKFRKCILQIKKLDDKSGD